MTRFKTIARTSGWIICYSYVANVLPRDSTSNSRFASAPSSPTLLRALSTKTFPIPFFPSRKKQSLSSRKFDFPSRSPFFSFGENNKSISDGRLQRYIRPRERQIPEPLVCQRLLITHDTANVADLAQVDRFARLAHVDQRVVLWYESILFRALYDGIYLTFAQGIDPYI